MSQGNPPTSDKSTLAKIKIDALRQVRALDDMAVAHAHFRQVLLAWNSPGPVRSILFQAGVVAYGRVFTAARTDHGLFTYPVSAFKNVDGFEKEIHDELLQLRHQFFAHSDHESFPPKITIQYWDIEANGELIASPPAIATAISYSWSDVSDKAFAESVRTHVSIVLSCIESRLKGLLRQYAVHPDNLSRPPSDNPELAGGSFEVHNGMVVPDTTKGLKKSLFEPPKVLKNNTRYQYRATSLHAALTVKYKLPNGREDTFIPNETGSIFPPESLVIDQLEKVRALEKSMSAAAMLLDFEKAILLRDEIRALEMKFALMQQSEAAKIPTEVIE